MSRGAPEVPSPDRDAPRGRSSRLGGAIVIGVSVLLVAAVIVFVLTRGSDEPAPTAEATASRGVIEDLVSTSSTSRSKSVRCSTRVASTL